MKNTIKNSNAKYKTIIANISEVIIIMDYSGRIHYVSPNVEKYFGWTIEDIVDTLIWERILIDDMLLMKEVFDSLDSGTGITEKGECRYQCKDGSYKWIEFTAINCTDDNSINGILFNYRDITEQKWAKEVQKASEERSRLVFENSPISIWEEDFSEVKALFDNLKHRGITDLDAYFEQHPESIRKCAEIIKILDVNNAALTMHEASRKEELFAGLINIFTQESFDVFRKELVCLWNGGIEMNADATVRTFSGKLRNVSVYFSVCPGYERTLSKVLVSIIDITERKLNEEIVHKSEEKYRTLFEESFDGLFITSPEGKILDMNKKGIAMFGYDTKEEILSLDLVRDVYAYPPDRKKILAMVNAKGAAEYEVVVKKKNGDKMVTYCSLTAVKNESGEIITYRGIIRDITESKRIETALRESEIKHRIVADNTYDWEFWLGTKGRFLYTSPSCKRITGYSADEFLADFDLINRIIHPDDRELFNNHWHEMLRTQSTCDNLDFRLIRKDGMLCWIQHTCQSVFDSEGNFLGIRGSNRDITERKLAEEALQKSQEIYRKLIATVPDLIVRTDLEGNIVFINETDLPHWPNADLEKSLGRNLIEFVTEKDKERAKKNLKTIFQKQHGLQEYCLISDTGLEIVCEMHGNILRDSESNPYGMVFVIRNITERKKAEEELEQYRHHLEELIKERTAELEEVNKKLEGEILKVKEADEKVKLSLEKEKELSELKSRFISIASHEFRTPLTIIYSSTELLEKYSGIQEDENCFQHIERIKNSVTHLTSIMDDVLIIGRTEVGKVKYEPGKINLKKLCNNILDDIKVMKKPEHNINYEYLIEFEKFILDDKLLKYILINLLSNAVKYSVNGGDIDFVVKSEGNYILFDISDRGIGIPEKDQPFLFEPFHRCANVGTISGTGLGMSIIKRSVDMHEGYIEFFSKEGEGTKFKVFIPKIMNFEMKL